MHGGLLWGERDHTLAGVDVDVELVEKIATEEAVAHVRGRQVEGADHHAAHAGVTDFQTVDGDEIDPIAAGGADDLARRGRRGDPYPGRLERAGTDQRAVGAGVEHQPGAAAAVDLDVHQDALTRGEVDRRAARGDRKSTRLNS